jgi:phosphoglycolate phosphatase-like HAD superfamily hydrolase
VDLDGVVADFNAGWIGRYNAAFGERLHPDQVTTWDAPASLTRFAAMGEFWRWARTCGDEGRSLFSVLRPYPGAVAGLRSLLDAAHVAIITTKPTWAIPDTLAWLAALDLPLREVHITSDKPSVGCDVYVEDSPKQLVELRRRRPDAVVCRWVRPWNRPVEGAVDVEDFDDVLVVVRALARQR